MASNKDDFVGQGYLFEPNKVDYQYLVQSGSDSDSSDDTNAETGMINRQGRTKMVSSAWCLCGHKKVMMSAIVAANMNCWLVGWMENYVTEKQASRTT